MREQFRSIPNVPFASPARSEDTDSMKSISFEDLKISDVRSFGSGITIKPTAADNPFLDESRNRSRGDSILYDSERHSEEISENPPSDSEGSRGRSPIPRNLTDMEEVVSRIGASW